MLEVRCFDRFRNRWAEWCPAVGGPVYVTPETLQAVESILRPLKASTALIIRGLDESDYGGEQYRLVPDVCDKCRRPL